MQANLRLKGNLTGRCDSGPIMRDLNTVTMRLNRLLNKIVQSERGTSSVEYGLILSFIVLVMLVSLGAMADVTIAMWTDVAEKSSVAMARP